MGLDPDSLGILVSLMGESRFGVIKCPNLMLHVSAFPLDDNEKLTLAPVAVILVSSSEDPGSICAINCPLGANRCGLSLEKTNILGRLVLENLL